MRRYLVMLLSLWCILLPLQAGAGNAAGDDKHCPHMQDMKASAAISVDQNADHHGCCNDAATVAKTGQLCKAGHECSPTLGYMLAPTHCQFVVTSDARQRQTIPIPRHTSPPSAVWRPPTLS